MTAAAVEIDGIAKSFGSVAVLREVSLRIAAGEFLTLLGPSGCGKSTLLRIIAGLEQQDAGSIRLDARPVDALRPRQRNVAMVFQSYALYPHMTVFDNIALPLVMGRLSAAQRLPLVGRFLPGAAAARAGIADDVRAAARALDIEPLLGRRPGQLSGGQKQRVAVGRALVRQPAAFLMDEPLSNLDANLRVHMRAELTELHRRLGATLIYVTHDQVEAMTMSDRVAVMIGGRLLQVAAPRTIYADPDSLEVAGFIGSPKINVLPAVARGGGQVEVAGVTLRTGVAAPAGTALQLGLRPEMLALAPAGAAGALAATVRHVEHLGPEALVQTALADGTVRAVARVEPGAAGRLAAGQPVGLMPAATPLVFDQAGLRLRPPAAADGAPVLAEARHG